MSAPITPPAPGRLSTITFCFIASCIFCPTRRAVRSVAPPGAYGTTTRTGFAGSAWAATGAAAAQPNQVKESRTILQLQSGVDWSMPAAFMMTSRLVGFTLRSRRLCAVANGGFCGLQGCERAVAGEPRRFGVFRSRNIFELGADVPGLAADLAVLGGVQQRWVRNELQPGPVETAAG